MRTSVMLITFIFVWAGIQEARCQYYSLSQQTLLTKKDHKNPKVIPVKKEKRHVKKRLDRAKEQEQFIVTGAGNIELAEKKLQSRRHKTGSRNNYTTSRTKPQNGIFKSPPPRSAFKKNYYRSAKRKGRNE
ncbi:MAG: hypothetical protein ABJH04_07920 [Cyclobacteriaceae bacterium]